MTFKEWLKVYSFPMWDDHEKGIKVASYDAVGDMQEAWNIAKADDLAIVTRILNALELSGVCDALLVRAAGEEVRKEMGK